MNVNVGIRMLSWFVCLLKSDNENPHSKHGLLRSVTSEKEEKYE